MTEIKRYDFIPEDDSYHEAAKMKESPAGQWVRWEDVQELLQEQEKEMNEYIEELQLLSERVQRLIDK